jgi:hypothetical protein
MITERLMSAICASPMEGAKAIRLCTNHTNELNDEHLLSKAV